MYKISHLQYNCGSFCLFVSYIIPKNIKHIALLLCLFFVNVYTLSAQKIDYSAYSNIPNISASQYILIDTTWNTVLAGRATTQSVSIASLTKLMTTAVVLDAINNNTFDLEKKYTVRSAVFKDLPIDASRMGLTAENKPMGINLLKGLLISSGNDAALLMADIIAGSEHAFVSMMNMKAKELGLSHTFFVDSTGLNFRNKSTAEDLVILVQYLLEYKKFNITQITSQKSMMWNGVYKQSTNILLLSDDNIDGIKTGYTEEAGFNLIATSKYKNRRLIAVVLNIDSLDFAQGILKRSEEAKKLIDYGYDSFIVLQLSYFLDEMRVWGSRINSTTLRSDPKSILLHKDWQAAIQTHYTILHNLWTPLDKNELVGFVNYTVSFAQQHDSKNISDIVLAHLDLRTTEVLAPANFFIRLYDGIRYLFRNREDTREAKVRVFTKVL